jgi:prepilin-type N-terminal cleavage/methylation domain-containing protein
MKIKQQDGFSIVELIVVVVIIGIIAAIAVPYLQKALHASQNGNIFSSLKTAATTQVNFYTKNNRYARLDELNNELSGSLGTPSGTDLVKGNFIITMAVPNPNPTDAELSGGEYEIIATRQLSGSDLPYVASIDQTGRVSDNLFSQY